MLLSLGLEDRIVGTAFSDGPLPDELVTDLPVLSEKLPSPEVVLEAEPDFIYAGWESNFSPDGAGERASLASLGIASYVSPAACRSLAPTKLTFADVFAQITEMGRIFDVETNAKTLVARQQDELASVPADTRGLTAVWYSSGTKTPYIGAGSGAPAMMMDSTTS
jgi:iron complex transport system substrate-binding protein